MTRVGPDQPNADQPGYIERLVGQHYAQPDDLIERLEGQARYVDRGGATPALAADLREAAEALRFAPPEQVDPEDVERLRDLVEVGPGSHLNRLDRAALARVVAALEPATPDPAPDRVAECRCHGEGGWTDLHGGWEPCPDCSDRVAEDEARVERLAEEWEWRANAPMRGDDADGWRAGRCYALREAARDLRYALREPTLKEEDDA